MGTLNHVQEPWNGRLGKAEELLKILQQDNDGDTGVLGGGIWYQFCGRLDEETLCNVWQLDEKRGGLSPVIQAGAYWGQLAGKKNMSGYFLFLK